MDSIHPIRFEEGQAMLLAGLRRWHTHAGAPQTIPLQWADFTTGELFPNRKAGCVSYGVLCAARPGEFEYMTAIEVQTFDGLAPNSGRMRIPPLRFAVFQHEGPVSSIYMTWRAIWEQWLPNSGMKPVHAPEFERYDHRYNPVTRDGIIEIWSPVAPE